jgi:SMODS domain-containing protein
VWQYVIPHFSQFLSDLNLKADERSDAENKAQRVARCLWDKYYSGEFNPNCYVKVGSYGKGTASRPPSDLDVLFLLPPHVYWRVEGLYGNKQSQLLQEVKRALLTTYPRSDLRADGQVVLAPFQTYSVEIVPAFLLTDGTYITANTADGGSWRPSNPVAECQAVAYADSVSAGKATQLLKMLKTWKRECSVEIKSISLEVLARVFLEQWQFRDRGLLYYDWLVRDFFNFMLDYKNGWTLVPGTVEKNDLGDAWLTKCQNAYSRSVKACEYERLDYGRLAAEEWQKIFGQQFRLSHLASMAASA